MSKKNRKVPEINSSSMADISFLLLIFFIVTTTMVTDKGLSRRLPPPVIDKKEKPEVDIKKRNVLVVLLNSNNQLMVQGKQMPIYNLRDVAKEFIVNPNDNPELPEKVEMQINNFGSYFVTSNHIISLQNDRGTEYQAYIEVQNELVGAYDDVRNELALSRWGMPFNQLREEQKEAIRDIYPQRISEAEPKNYGGNQ